MNIKRIVGIGILISCLVFVFSACDTPRPQPKRHNSEYACAKLNGIKGMIVHIYYTDNFGNSYYKVRFSSPVQKTNTHILSNDDEVDNSQFYTEDMYDFELDNCP